MGFTYRPERKGGTVGDQAGKGDRRRPCFVSDKQYTRNYEKAFGKQETVSIFDVLRKKRREHEEHIRELLEKG